MRLALVGLRFRGALWLLLALGLVPATALTVLAAGMQVETRIAGVQQALDTLDAADRTVLSVTSIPLPADRIDAADQLVRAGYRAAGFSGVERTLTFRLLSLAGTDVTVGAVTPLPDGVRLLSGRLPTACTPTRCEVLAVGAVGGAVLDPAALAAAPATFGLVVTGTAELADRRLVAGGLVTPSAPLLLGADPSAMAGLQVLAGFGRTTGWLASVDGTAVATNGVPDTENRLAGMVAGFGTAFGPLLLSWPAAIAEAAVARSAVAAERFGALGAGVGALQLAFCAVVAVSVRRRTRWVCGVLTARGAPRWSAAVLSVLQPVPAVLLGALVGLGTGIIVVAMRLTALLGSTFAAGLHESVSIAGTAVAAIAALSATAVAMTAVISALPDRLARSSQLVIDTLTALLLVGLLWSSGGAFTLTGSAPFVGICLFAGLVAARVVPLLPRVSASALGLRHFLPRMRRRPGIAALSRRARSRRPLVPAVIAGFLAAACALTVFAVAYRQSLGQSAADQAAAQVPLDLRISASTEVSTPGSVVDPNLLRAAAPGVTIAPLTSTAVSVAPGTPRARSTNLIGMDPSTVPLMTDFPVTTGTGTAAAAVAASLRTAAPVDDRPLLAAGPVRFAASGISADIQVKLWIESANGSQQAITLTPSGSSQLVGRIPADAEVVAVEVAESADFLVHRQHGVGEGDTDRAQAAGTLTLGRPTGTASGPGWSWSGWTASQAELTATADQLAIRYRIDNRRVVAVPAGGSGAQAGTPQNPLPMVVDPVTASAAVDGRLSIAVAGTTITGTIVAVAPFWPGVSAPYAIADRSAVSGIVSADAPGSQPVTQVWLAAPAEQLGALRTALDGSAAGAATITERAVIEQTLRADPTTRRTILMVMIAALIALLLAWVAIALAVRADHDGAASEQLALELDGLTPSRLRLLLLGRSLGAGVLGIALGALAGVWAAASGVPALAGSATVVPALRIVGQSSAGWIALITMLGAALAVVVAARTLFRGQQPSLQDGEVR